MNLRNNKPQYITIVFKHFYTIILKYKVKSNLIKKEISMIS